MLSVYLDVDGVLRGCASPKEDIEAFLWFCLENCYCYWLTSYCRGGMNIAVQKIGDISPELKFELEARFQPTDWRFSKSEAIDYSEPFVWFDDNAPMDMLSELNGYGPNARKNFYLVDSSDPDAAKKMLQFLKDLIKENDGNNLSDN